MYDAKFDADFLEDIERLDKRARKQLEKIILKVKENPAHAKRLRGGTNYFRIRFLVYRVIYYFDGKTVYFRRVRKRDIVYR